MTSKKTRVALSADDPSERLRALDSIKSLTPKDIDCLVESAWSFDESYIRQLVQQIRRVKDEKSALVIASILFSSTDKSQEAVRIQCLGALSENPTETATNVLINAAKNQKFYRTQCEAVKRLASRKKGDRVLRILHEIVKEDKYLASMGEAKQQPFLLLLSAFEALSSKSLRNLESALLILDRVADPSSDGACRDRGVETLAGMRLDSLVDPVLDKIEENEADRTLVYPLLRVIKDSEHTKAQRDRIHKLIEKILPTIDQNQQINNDLVAIMKVVLDEDLVDIVSTATCNWQLNTPAGRQINGILDTCSKNEEKTINALFRYVETGQWPNNKDYILPNLNSCYLAKPVYVIRKAFQNDKPNYVIYRNELMRIHNTPENRESFLTNITSGLEIYLKQPQQDTDVLDQDVSRYFDELGKILVPLLKRSISDEDWRLCSKGCLYRLVNLSTRLSGGASESLCGCLAHLIHELLNITATFEEFIERACDDWLSLHLRTPSKYVLLCGCEIDIIGRPVTRALVRRAASYSRKARSATRQELQFQRWVSNNVVSMQKGESNECLVEDLTQDGVFNEWVYGTLKQHRLLDASIIAKASTSSISDRPMIGLLEDLTKVYSSDAEGVLVGNIRSGRTVKIRAVAARAAGAIFDYRTGPQCPDVVLEALHDKFSEDTQVRKAAYTSLGRICSDQSIDALWAAKRADTKLKDVPARSLDSIFQRFSRSKPKEESVQSTIAWITVIGKLRDRRGFKLLKPFVDPSSYHREKTVRIAAVESMGSVGTSEDIPFLEGLKETWSHVEELLDGIERSIGLVSNVADFPLLDLMRKLTDSCATFSDSNLDLPKIFSDKSASVKSQGARAYKAWLGADYSLYTTHLDNVCDSVSKRLLDVFQNQLFGSDDEKYVRLRGTDKTKNRYEFLRSRSNFSLIGTCFCTVHALRVEAPIPHGEDSKTEQLKTDLTREEGELAKKNFIDAITRSVEMIKKKILR